MSEAFFTFFGIYLLCLIKFFAGPVLGAAAGYSPLEIIGVSVLGMMTSVTFFTFLGTRVKKVLQERSKSQKKIFTKKKPPHRPNLEFLRRSRNCGTYADSPHPHWRHFNPGFLWIRKKENLGLHATKRAHLGSNI